MLNSLHAKPLDASRFSPFGDVIELREDNVRFPINQGTAVRHHALSKVQLSGTNDEAIFSIFLTEQVVLPFTAESMECHPLGSQAFIPLSDSPYLVAVAPAGDQTAFCRVIHCAATSRHQLSSGRLAYLYSLTSWGKSVSSLL